MRTQWLRKCRILFYLSHLLGVIFSRSSKRLLTSRPKPFLRWPRNKPLNRVKDKVNSLFRTSVIPRTESVLSISRFILNLICRLKCSPFLVDIIRLIFSLTNLDLPNNTHRSDPPKITTTAIRANREESNSEEWWVHVCNTLIYVIH